MLNEPTFLARAAAPPPGFRPLLFEDGFIKHNGPVYVKDEADMIFGFRVLPRHCNPMGICHGGWIASAMDMVLPLTARLRGGFPFQFMLTVHMSLDYLGPARLGDWVEGRAQVTRKTNRLVFMRGQLEIDGEPCTQGSGIFRVGPDAPPLQF